LRWTGCHSCDHRNWLCSPSYVLVTRRGYFLSCNLLWSYAIHAVITRWHTKQQVHIPMLFHVTGRLRASLIYYKILADQTS
jgi:hypothetical protein